MEQKYIKPFFHAIATTFDRMIGASVKPLDASLKQDFSRVHNVTAIIGMSGDLVGAVVLSMSFETARAVVAAFLQMDDMLEEEELADAVGELVNIIAGSAKAKFEGMDVTISTPTIAIGDSHQIRAPRVVPVIEIPCSSDLGDFVVDVAISNRE